MDAFAKGKSTEAAVLARLLERGFTVALPVGVHRYDLLVEFERFKKVQVKTGRRPSRQPGVLLFPLATVNPVTGKRRPYSRKDVDVFLVHDSVTGKIYKVPSKKVSGYKSEFQFRLVPAKNNQKKRTHMASDFEL
jgi:hypothetical protein